MFFTPRHFLSHTYPLDVLTIVTRIILWIIKLEWVCVCCLGSTANCLANATPICTSSCMYDRLFSLRLLALVKCLELSFVGSSIDRIYGQVLCVIVLYVLSAALPY